MTKQRKFANGCDEDCENCPYPDCEKPNWFIGRGKKKKPAKSGEKEKRPQRGERGKT